MLILVKLSHLFFLLHFGINALPVLNKKSDNSNSTSTTSESKLVVAEIPTALNDSLVLPKFEIPKDFNLTQVVQDLKGFGIHSLKEDKHLEGLPLDREGKVNLDFHKEIFLGNHEEFESEIQNDKNKRDKKLEEIFNAADVNSDGRLTKDELVDHVYKNVQDHLKEAKDKNAQLFVLIDSNQDGKITWHEYFALYIKLHHMNSSSLKDLDDINFIQDNYDETLRHELLKIRYRWTDTDGGGDNQLDVDEFLAFRHPEIAGRTYKYVVDDIIAHMDQDDDQRLNITEFAFLPTNALDDKANKEWAEMDRRWLEEQRKEFHEMDEDQDGILTRDELLKAYDPLNRLHINNRIKRLFPKADDSPKDEGLTLGEVQKHADIFMDMRILDTAKVLHEDM